MLLGLRARVGFASTGWGRGIVFCHDHPRTAHHCSTVSLVAVPRHPASTSPPLNNFFQLLQYFAVLRYHQRGRRNLIPTDTRQKVRPTDRSNRKHGSGVGCRGLQEEHAGEADMDLVRLLHARQVQSYQHKRFSRFVFGSIGPEQEISVFPTQ